MKYNDVLSSIGVFEAPDNYMPIGIAHCRTWDDCGLAVWELTARGQKIPGWLIIVDREFRVSPRIALGAFRAVSTFNPISPQ